MVELTTTIGAASEASLWRGQGELPVPCRAKR